MEITEVVKQVLEFLEKTGTAIAQTGFPIAVKFAIADGITKLAKGTIGAVIFGICLFGLLKIMKKWDEDKKNESQTNVESVKIIVYCVLGVLSMFTVLFSGFFEGIKILLSPEWYAILNIIELFN